VDGHSQGLPVRDDRRRPAFGKLPNVAEVKVSEQGGAKGVDLADVGVLHASSRSVGVAGVIVRIVVGGVLELVDEIPSREPVIQAKLVVNSQDTLIQVLADAGLIGEEACPSQACRQQPIREGESNRVHSGPGYLIV